LISRPNSSAISGGSTCSSAPCCPTRLAVSGRLDRTLGGPPIDPHRPREDPAKRLVSGPVDGHGRRSIYIKMTLMEPPRFLAIFNQPLPKVTVGKRDRTTTVRSKGTPVDNILAADPPEVQRAKLDFLRSQSLAAAGPAETAAVEAAIRTYETAARMQTTIPDVCDVASETEATRRLYGRDHHVSGYTIWLAGGGFKGGNVYGTTDEMGMGVVENPLDIHDIHATVLRQLGIDHKRFTFRFGGRDMRLTDVKGRVIADLLA
jgi:hypothetical protein